jgi:hypothetical protein
MTEKLGLNDEQQGKIKAIYEKNAPKLKNFRPRVARTCPRKTGPSSAS